MSLAQRILDAFHKYNMTATRENQNASTPQEPANVNDAFGLDPQDQTVSIPIRWQKKYETEQNTAHVPDPGVHVTHPHRPPSYYITPSPHVHRHFGEHRPTQQQSEKKQQISTPSIVASMAITMFQNKIPQIPENDVHCPPYSVTVPRYRRQSSGASGRQDDFNLVKVPQPGPGTVMETMRPDNTDLGLRGGPKPCIHKEVKHHHSSSKRKASKSKKHVRFRFRPYGGFASSSGTVPDTNRPVAVDSVSRGMELGASNC